MASAGEQAHAHSVKNFTWRATVKNTLMAGAIAIALMGSPAGAAQAQEDLGEIRNMLRGLMQRVDKLEQENTTLRSENENLKAQSDYLREETKGLRKDTAVAAADIAKTRGSDWASRISLKGDLRYRYEYIADDTFNNATARVQTADRYRDRLRARFNMDARATDNILVGLGFSTTEGGDPRSSNQTLTGVFNRKSLDLDLAFFDWKFASFGNLIAGKMKQPFYKPAGSLYWDNDINPEGVALTFSRGTWFGSAFGYQITEVNGLETLNTADTMLFGGQIGTRIPIGSSTLTLAAMYYDLAAGERRVPAPFFNGISNGNSTVNINTGTVAAPVLTPVLANDFRVVSLGGDFSYTMFGQPMSVWFDLAQNQDPEDFDEAFSGGVTVGRASNPGSWEFGVGFYAVEKDSIFGQLFDSDFGSGVTDSEGMVIRAGFAPVRNWTLNLTYFMNDRNVDVVNGAGQKDVNYDRGQVDVNLKF